VKKRQIINQLRSRTRNTHHTIGTEVGRSRQLDSSDASASVLPLSKACWRHWRAGVCCFGLVGGFGSKGRPSPPSSPLRRTRNDPICMVPYLRSQEHAPSMRRWCSSVWPHQNFHPSRGSRTWRAKALTLGIAARLSGPACDLLPQLSTSLAGFFWVVVQEPLKRSATTPLLFARSWARNLFRMLPAWTSKILALRRYEAPSSFSGSYPPAPRKRKGSHLGEGDMIWPKICPA
jgi:hypothetical protein